MQHNYSKQLCTATLTTIDWELGTWNNCNCTLSCTVIGPTAYTILRHHSSGIPAQAAPGKASIKDFRTACKAVEASYSTPAANNGLISVRKVLSSDFSYRFRSNSARETSCPSERIYCVFDLGVIRPGCEFSPGGDVSLGNQTSTSRTSLTNNFHRTSRCPLRMVALGTSGTKRAFFRASHSAKGSLKRRSPMESSKKPSR